MVIVQIVYLYEEGYHFDLNYWSTKHRGLFLEKVGSYIKNVSREFGVKSIDSNTPSIVVTSRIEFESMEAYEKVPKKDWDLLFADVKNFTNLKPLVNIATDEMPQ